MAQKVEILTHIALAEAKAAGILGGVGSSGLARSRLAGRPARTPSASPFLP
jgi:hypothetical protein